jgi:hypothetical protein
MDLRTSIRTASWATLEIGASRGRRRATSTNADHRSGTFCHGESVAEMAFRAEAHHTLSFRCIQSPFTARTHQTHRPHRQALDARNSRAATIRADCRMAVRPPRSIFKCPGTKDLSRMWCYKARTALHGGFPLMTNMPDSKPLRFSRASVEASPPNEDWSAGTDHLIVIVCIYPFNRNSRACH